MAQTTATEVRVGILATNEAFMAAFSRGDATACAACYTEQGQVLPPNSDVITGREAIQTFWQGAMHMGITAAKLETVEVDGHGNTANEVGKYTLQGAGGRYSTRESTSSFGNKRRGSGRYTAISGIAAGQHQDSSTEPTPGQTTGGKEWESYE
jgi:ketosteroid isomerase-like protein